jgi:hypothetical protein
VTVLLIAYKWNRFGVSEQIWAGIMIGIGTGLALYMLFHRKDLFYALAIDWAVTGILIKRTVARNTPAQAVIITAIVSICAMTLAIIAQVARRKVYR